jgi:hypothetical protein
MSQIIAGKSDRSHLQVGGDRLRLTEERTCAPQRRAASARGPEGADLLPPEEELLRELIVALRGLRYGSVLLTVHDGRVVEIDKTTRIRRTNGSL